MNDNRPAKTGFDFALAAAAAASAMGVAAFAYLFLRDLTVFWIVLSPVIFSVYQLPALVLFRIAKKRRTRGQTRPLSDRAEANPVEDETAK